MALARTSRASQGSKKAPAMKVMKAKRVTKVAKGRMAKALVFRGSKEKTVGGLKQEALMKNKRGKVVSKRQSAAGKRRYRNIETWVDSVMEARKALHISGFCAINGKTLQGKALYVKTKSLLVTRTGAAAAAASPARSPGRPSASAAGCAEEQQRQPASVAAAGA